jgi:peptidoglycan/LPS O-acetylase OafA/YrhL
MAMLVSHGQDARTFAISRLARIVPLYWVLTTCLLVLAAVKPELLNSTTANLAHYLKSLFFIPYFKENGALHPMLAVGWTLNYEMFFYASLWLALLTPVRQPMWLGLLLMALCWAGPGQFAQSAVWRSFLGDSLIFEFALGCLAHEAFKRQWLQQAPAWVAAGLALLSYAFMAWGELADTGQARLFTYGLPSMVLVVAITALEPTRFMQGHPIARVLAKLGDASYATYLSHFYVVEGIRKIAFLKLGLINPYTLTGVVFTLAGSLAVGHLLYTWLDRPLSQRLKARMLATWRTGSRHPGPYRSR